MISGEKTKCLLCGQTAERGPFSNALDPTKTAGGLKYECHNCGLYALNAYEHSWIENFCSREKRIKLSEYVKSHPDKEGNYKVLSMDEIRRVLKK